MTTDQDVMDRMYQGLQALEQHPGLTGLTKFFEDNFDAMASDKLKPEHGEKTPKTKTWGPIYAAILKGIIEQNPDSDDATNAQSIFDEIELYFQSDSFHAKVDITHNNQKLSRGFGIEKEFLHALTDIKAAVAFCARIDMQHPPDQEITDPDRPTPEEETYLKARILRDAARWPHMVAAGGSATPNEFNAQVASVCQKFPYTLLAGYSWGH